MGDVDNLRKVVESHSSQITNQRIGDIKEKVWQIGLAASSTKPDPKEVLAYYSALEQYWLEVPGIIDDTDYEQIKKYMKDCNWYASTIRVTNHISLADLENFLQKCKALQSMLNMSLQRKAYFFKVGKPQPKGIDQALAIFKEGKWEEEAPEVEDGTA